MPSKPAVLPILGVVVGVVLGATVVSLALQAYFGRLRELILLRPLLGAIGAAGLALWIGKGR
jgi:hypothetical protein